MAQYRVLISLENSASLTAEDFVVNTFYLDTDALSGSDDPQALVQDAVGVWFTNVDVVTGFNLIRGRIYDMSDPKPRSPVGEHVQAASASGESGPREVALCLSYYAGQNVPRKRGRMYFGPFFVSRMAERPADTVRNKLAAIAAGISGLGGVNVQWVQYSPTTLQFSNVTHWWVDNEWDTMRSRGLKGTTRVQGDVSG